MALVEDSLSNRGRMPLEEQVVGRYLFLGKTVKSKKQRIAEIMNEVTDLWKQKLNFPMVLESSVRRKVMRLIALYSTCAKRSNFEPLNRVFDVTKIDGQWLNENDKKLYIVQLQTNATVGYSACSFASGKSIHPSILAKFSNSDKQTCVEVCDDSDENSAREENDGECSSSSENEDEIYSQRSKGSKKHKSNIAARLVAKANLSTRKASRICQQLCDEGIDIPTPSQQGVHKALFRKATEVKNYLIETLHEKNGVYISMEKF